MTAASQLLHNICVGQLHDLSTARSDPSSLATFMASSNRLADLLLAGVGAVLDQPSHGPELRAIVIALAGRLLPLCSSQRVSDCFFLRVIQPATSVGIREHFTLIRKLFQNQQTTTHSVIRALVTSC